MTETYLRKLLVIGSCGDCVFESESAEVFYCVHRCVYRNGRGRELLRNAFKDPIDIPEWCPLPNVGDDPFGNEEAEDG